MGNWVDISEQYVKSKNAEECEEHYFTFYYKSRADNIPVESETVIKGSRKFKKEAKNEFSIDYPLDLAKCKEAEQKRKAFQQLK